MATSFEKPRVKKWLFWLSGFWVLVGFPFFLAAFLCPIPPDLANDSDKLLVRRSFRFRETPAADE